MPGEERKFKRRRTVALFPTCKWEREVTASHADREAFVVGVGVASAVAVAVGDGVGVAVGSGTWALVGAGVGEAVAVGRRGVGETGAVVGLAKRAVSVVVGVARTASAVPVGGSSVEALEGDIHIKRMARINRKIATINLKRS